MKITWNDELYHYGMPRRSGRYKWGSGKNPFHHGSDGGRKKHNVKSLNPSVMMARRRNMKVDKSFDEWKKGAAARDKAIASGKKRNELKIAYQKNPSDKDLKKQYKEANTQYKKDLRANTSYRKGTVRQDVGRDMARKHLSAAKKADNDRDYKKHMKQYEVERAKAGRAQQVGASRSSRKAALKRSLKTSMKVAAGTAVTAAALREVSKHKDINISSQDVARAAEMFRKAQRMRSFMY